MLSAIHHRGPDEQGRYLTGRVGLGIARLSIVDIEGGSQPIWNEDKTVAVIFNGEIYNHEQLRKDLISRGHIFSSRSDTEVIVHLYEELKSDCFALLNGMFAVAIFDARSQELFLAKDRFGIKPLFYSLNESRILFGSEIKAVLTDPDLNREIDPMGIALGLNFMFIPEPWTSYRNIRKVRSGHYLAVRSNSCSEICYSDIDFQTRYHYTRKELIQAVSERLIKALRLQTATDVQVCSLLSGGLDSSIISLLTHQFSTASPAVGIGFQELNFDEGALATKFAKAIGMGYERTDISEAQLCGNLLLRQRQLDEPYGLWCNSATAILAASLRARGFKVVLGGDGGDELFFGYPTVHAAHLIRWVSWLPKKLLKKSASWLGDLLPAGQGRLPMSFMLKSFVRGFDSDVLRSFFRFKEVIGKELWSKSLTPAARHFLCQVDPFEAYRQYDSRISDLPLCDKLAYLDFKVFLSGCSLAGVDNAFMASSVELRVPFLDNELVDLVTGTSPRLRFDLKKPKALLKDVGRGLLQNYARETWAHIERKRGFEVPCSVWLQSPGLFRQLLTDTLNKKRIKRIGFFSSDYVDLLIQRQIEGRDNHERQLQAVMSCQLFFERAGVSFT